MNLSESEVARIRRLLLEIDNGMTKARVRQYVGTRTRNIRLLLTRAERREKNTLI